MSWPCSSLPFSTKLHLSLLSTDPPVACCWWTATTSVGVAVLGALSLALPGRMVSGSDLIGGWRRFCWLKLSWWCFIQITSQAGGGNAKGSELRNLLTGSSSGIEKQPSPQAHFAWWVVVLVVIQLLLSWVTVVDSSNVWPEDLSSSQFLSWLHRWTQTRAKEEHYKQAGPACWAWKPWQCIVRSLGVRDRRGDMKSHEGSNEGYSSTLYGLSIQNLIP